MVSSLGEAAALAALEDNAHLQRALINNAEGVKWMTARLMEMGYNPIQTWANFVCCEMGEDAAALAKRLQDEGIIVRPLGGPWGARTAIRVTIGTPEQNQRFLSALKKVTASVTVNS